MWKTLLGWSAPLAYCSSACCSPACSAQHQGPARRRRSAGGCTSSALALHGNAIFGAISERKKPLSVHRERASIPAQPLLHRLPSERGERGFGVPQCVSALRSAGATRVPNCRLDCHRQAHLAASPPDSGASSPLQASSFGACQLPCGRGARGAGNMTMRRNGRTLRPSGQKVRREQRPDRDRKSPSPTPSASASCWADYCSSSGNGSSPLHHRARHRLPAWRVGVMKLYTASAFMRHTIALTSGKTAGAGCHRRPRVPGRGVPTIFAHSSLHPLALPALPLLLDMAAPSSSSTPTSGVSIHSANHKSDKLQALPSYSRRYFILYYQTSAGWGTE